MLKIGSKNGVQKRGSDILREKICDVCGVKFIRGLEIKALHKGISPWTKKIFICDKCENVMKLLILQHRKIDEAKKIFEE